VTNHRNKKLAVDMISFLALITPVLSSVEFVNK
jgi:hypothetical protein